MQWLLCKLGRHDWMTFWYYERFRRRCNACPALEERDRFPGETWYQLRRYRLPTHR